MYGDYKMVALCITTWILRCTRGQWHDRRRVRNASANKENLPTCTTANSYQYNHQMNITSQAPSPSWHQDTEAGLGRNGEVCKNRWIDLTTYTLLHAFLQKDGSFWDGVDNSAHLGGQIPQNPILGVWTGIFEPNAQNIIKTTALIPTKFHTVIKTNKWSSWVAQTHETTQPLNQSPRNLAQWGTLLRWTLLCSP